ncbi:MAG TPA: hypothetical protein VIM63_01610 [Rhodoferax sp.]
MQRTVGSHYIHQLFVAAAFAGRGVVLATARLSKPLVTPIIPDLIATSPFVDWARGRFVIQAAPRVRWRTDGANR